MKSLFCLTLLAVAFGKAAIAQPKEAILYQFTVPFDDAMRLKLKLPKDGAVVSSNDAAGPLTGIPLTKDRWPENEAGGPFETHETVEISLGRIIRARARDRKHERALGKPGIALHYGTLTVRGGWRVHKRVRLLGDYYDGTFEVKILGAVNNGQPQIQLVELKTVLNGGPDWIPKLLLAGKLRKLVERDLPSRLAEALLNGVRAEKPKLAGKFPLLKLVTADDLAQVLCIDFVPGAVRVTLCKSNYVRRLVGIHEFQPPFVGKGKSDRDFRGHGPQVTVDYGFSKSADTRGFNYRLEMRAIETKRDWTEARGVMAFRIYTAPENAAIGRVWATRMHPVPKTELILGAGDVLSGPHRLLDKVVEGHDPRTFPTDEGEVKVWGDHKGNDAGNHTRVEVRSPTIVTFEIKPS